MFDDSIVSHLISLHPNMQMIKEMLDKAFKNYKIEGIIHSDQGGNINKKIIKKNLLLVESYRACQEKAIVLITRR